ncbi:hypothetical protein ABK040_005346 [Willaertia magna]
MKERWLLIGGFFIVLTLSNLTLFLVLTRINKNTNNNNSSTNNNILASAPIKHDTKVDNNINSDTHHTSIPDKHQQKHNKPHQITFGKKPGYFKCNKYIPDVSKHVYIKKLYQEDLYKTNTIFQTCQFENICLTRGGDFVFYLEKDNLIDPSWFTKYNNQSWIYVQGRIHTPRGNLNILIREGTLIRKPNDPNLYVSTNTGNPTITTSSTSNLKVVPTAKDIFQWMEEPTFLLKRFVAGNAGHNIMDNLHHLIHLMHSYNRVTVDNQIIFLDDLQDQTKPHWEVGAYGYPVEPSDSISISSFSLITKSPVKQLCHNEKGSYSIERAPCRNKLVNNNVALNEKEKDELVTCFSSVFGGHSVSDLLAPWSREIVGTKLRELVYQRLDLPIEEDLKEKKEIIIAINEKSLSGRHGRIIWNVQDLYSNLTTFLPQDPFIKKLGKSIKVIKLKLNEIPMVEQIKIFEKTDVYFADQGSASYNVVYMRDRSTMVYAPACLIHLTKKYVDCYPGMYFTLGHFTTAQVIHFLDFMKNGVVPCNPRMSPHEKGRDLINCDPILDPKLVIQISLSAIKRKYSHLV